MTSPIVYDRTGTGEPLLLVHGLGSRRQIWAPLIPQLAEHHDVIAVDLPGFGESPAGIGTAFPQLIDAVVALCDDLGLDRPHVAGNSMGGGLALELARRNRARSVTAFSPIGFWRRPGVVWCQASLGVTRSLARRIRPVIPPLLATTPGRAALTGIAFGRPSRLDPRVLIGDIDALLAAPGFAAASASFSDYVYVPARDSDVPVTIAWGTRDVLLTYATQSRRARRALPSAAHLTLPQCGHTPFYDDSDLCARTILRTTAAASPFTKGLTA